jgi:hypothetical protein
VPRVVRITPSRILDNSFFALSKAEMSIAISTKLCCMTDLTVCCKESCMQRVYVSGMLCVVARMAIC